MPMSIPMPMPVHPRVVASGYPFFPLPSCLKSAERDYRPLCPCPCPCRCPFASSPFFFTCFREGGRLTPPRYAHACANARTLLVGGHSLLSVFFYFLLKECGGLTIPFALPMPTPVLPRVPSPLPMPMPAPVLPRVVASDYPFCPLPSCLKSGAGLLSSMPAPMPMPMPVRPRVVASDSPSCPLPSCLRSAGRAYYPVCLCP